MKQTTTKIVTLCVICAAILMAGCIDPSPEQSKQPRDLETLAEDLKDLKYPFTATFRGSEWQTRFGEEYEGEEWTVTLHPGGIATTTATPIYTKRGDSTSVSRVGWDGSSRTTWKYGRWTGSTIVVKVHNVGELMIIRDDGTVTIAYGGNSYKGTW